MGSAKDMNSVTDNLYLGNITAAYDVEELTKAGISHVLTLNISPVEPKVSCHVCFILVVINKEHALYTIIIPPPPPTHTQTKSIWRGVHRNHYVCITVFQSIHISRKYNFSLTDEPIFYK